jgi:hypothetical protein
VNNRIRQQELILGLANAPFGSLHYQCNICEQACQTFVEELGREKSSCPSCGATVRMRSIIHLLSTELFGQSLTLPNFPVWPDIRGIGLSDWIGYAGLLPHKLNYTNTFYHQQPRLDIVAPIDPLLEDSLDFLISSDVFEHVSPPVSRAFDNTYRLLKRNGVLILTVPYTKEGQTQEHFPELHKFEIVSIDGRYILKNVTPDGRNQVFENLIFHGGDGATLEMRLFAESSLKHELTRAGFQDIRFDREPKFEYGIYWNPDWSSGSFPIVARKRSS